MPTYQYRCTDCGEELEVVQKFTDDPLSTCPACEGRLRKVFSAVGVVFKGSGFYRTDSRSDGSAAKADGSTADGSTADGTTADGTKADGTKRERPKETSGAPGGSTGSPGASGSSSAGGSKASTGSGSTSSSTGSSAA